MIFAKSVYICSHVYLHWEERWQLKVDTWLHACTVSKETGSIQRGDAERGGDEVPLPGQETLNKSHLGLSSEEQLAPKCSHILFHSLSPMLSQPSFCLKAAAFDKVGQTL